QRNVSAEALLVLDRDESDPIGAAIRVRIDQDPVEDAIDRRRCTDTHRQGENRAAGIDAIPGELPESEGNVLERCEHDASICEQAWLVSEITAIGLPTGPEVSQAVSELRAETHAGTSEDGIRCSDMDSLLSGSRP